MKRAGPRTEAKKASEDQLARGLGSHTEACGISPQAGVLDKGMRRPAPSLNRVTCTSNKNKPRATLGKNPGEVAVARAGKGVSGKRV